MIFDPAEGVPAAAAVIDLRADEGRLPLALVARVESVERLPGGAAERVEQVDAVGDGKILLAVGHTDERRDGGAFRIGDGEGAADRDAEIDEVVIVRLGLGQVEQPGAVVAEVVGVGHPTIVDAAERGAGLNGDPGVADDLEIKAELVAVDASPAEFRSDVGHPVRPRNRPAQVVDPGSDGDVEQRVEGIDRVRR
ncbi:MAG: hypothetical protein M5U09_15990 [Gammaproteobacteria bacterium]|nr:hypothetical protein [Gammaproteobacteria bacterium]